MTIPKPQKAPEIDLEAFLTKTRADEQEWAQRAATAQAQAAQAYARLLDIAERSDTGQAKRVASFIAASFNGMSYSFDLFDLRALDVAISDDVLICLDALRWAKADLFHLVPNGEQRVEALIQSWGIQIANE